MGISTHVLDVELGRPAVGVVLRLHQAADVKGLMWNRVREGITDEDGRCRTLVPDAEVVATGVYRIRFETAPYFAEMGREGLYPFVDVVFEVRDGRDGQERGHYHIPLLLAAHGFSTYRGS